MRSTLAAILILALAACDSGSSTEPDPTPDPPTVRDWRVVAVSGDQAARLGGPSVAASPRTFVARAGSPAVIGPDGYSDEPLVGVIQLTGEAEARGLSLDALPSGTLVHWHIEDGAGRLYATTTAPDDSMHILNRWAPSTVAGTYTASAGRLVDGEIVEDETWTLVVEPGPATQVQAPERVRLLAGETWTADVRVRDAYDNAIDYALTTDSTLATVNGRDVTAVAPGVAAYDVLIEDTIAGGGALYVYPDLVSPALWSAELVCETPAGTMIDRMEFRVDRIELGEHPTGTQLTDPGHWAALAGLDSASATVAYTTGLRRLVIEDGDTIYDTADGVRLDGVPIPDSEYIDALGPGDLVVSPTLDTLAWPGTEQPYRLPELRDHSARLIEGLPLLLTRDGEALSWSGEATAACASDGWPDATAGTWRVRVVEP